MLKEVIEDALSRGEKLRNDIVRQILSSTSLTQLLNNNHFANTVARVIQTKDVVTRVLRQNALDTLRLMRIPSKAEIRAYELRVQKLEKQIDNLGRTLMKKGLHSNSRPSRTRYKKR